MHTLNIDLETYCELNIKIVGLFKYVRHPSFKILLFGYKIDGEKAHCVDLELGELVPYPIIEALKNPCVKKKAWNVFFEYEALSQQYETGSFNSWYCTMAKSAYNGYPLGLGDAGRILGLNKTKIEEGKNLIQLFCRPNNRKFDIGKWNLFKKYCKRDVDVEFKIDSLLPDLPPREREIFCLDYKINRTGIKVNTALVKKIIALYSAHSKKLKIEAIALTSLENPNSNKQVRDWIKKIEGFEVTTLKAEAIPELLQKVKNAKTKRLLEIWQESNLSSIKKFNRMLICKCDNDRIYGLFQYYGAMRTGRFAGRLVQLHNLARQKEKALSLEIAMQMILKDYEVEHLQLLFGNIPSLFKELLRCSFIAGKNKTFIIPDFSAIEAVVLAFLAGEEWRLEVFRTHGKIYEASIAKMLRIPINEVSEEQRQKGKVSELSLGYQGAVGALIRMGALKMGLDEDELPGIVSAWRAANRRIVQFWKTAEDAARIALNNPGKTVFFGNRLLSFKFTSGTLALKLPSDRSLFYPGAAYDARGGIYYHGLDSGPTGGNKKWGKLQLYGGKIVENIVQAVARDILVEAMLRIDKELKLLLPLHVHDEAVCEVDKNIALKTEKKVIKIMATAPPWLPGIPLKVKSFISDYYRKG